MKRVNRFLALNSNKRSIIENWHGFLRGRRQLSVVPINDQLAARGGGVEVFVRKSVTKPSATIFYIVIKTTFKKYFRTLTST